MIILGINSYHPDSSAALVIEGKLIAACEEERFRRIKHFSGFPSEAIKYCIRQAGISIKDIDYIAIPRQPLARIAKKLFYGIKIPALTRRRLFAWRRALWIKEELVRIFDADEREIKAKIIKVEHHRAHIASSFFVSGFEKACLLSADALGDFASTAWGTGEGSKIKVLGEISFPHSLGFYYTAITQYLGFLKFGDEYKVMGLAAFGEPAFEDEFKRILKIKKQGFKLGLDYFLHHKKLVDMNFKNGYPQLELLFSPYLEKRLGKKRLPHEALEKRHNDIACSLQKRLEEAVLSLLNCLKTDSDYLCLSGGVAFNCVANAKIYDRTPFKNIYAPAACGDAGLAVGAAYYLWNHILNQPRNFVMDHAYWGPAYSEDEIQSALAYFKGSNFKIERVENEDLLCQVVAKLISEGKIVGWFQGRMEWGPRALGNRSILVDPRNEQLKEILNNRIKHREAFRPFAPSVLEEYSADFFQNSSPSPFMLFAYKVKEEKKNLIPAVVHIDGTARLETVNKKANLLYWKLLNEFNRLTGIPILLNTSFNENEPIVCNPKETLDCFFRTKMDILVIGPFIIQKDRIQ